MRQIKLTNIQAPVPEEKVVKLLFELHCLYHEGITAAKAYNDMASAMKSREYPCQDMAQRILDGAHGAKQAEMAHIFDRTFIQLRDFFGPLEHGHSE